MPQMRVAHQFDRTYTARLRGLPESWRPIMLGLSFIGEPWVVLLVGLAGFLIVAARPQPAIEHAFIYSGVAYGCNIALKLLLHRKRPHGRIVKTLGMKSYSFPSGHAFGTVILYGLLVDLALKYLTHPLSYIIAILVTAAILLIGLSRVYLGSHYPSDVVAGWILGRYFSFSYEAGFLVFLFGHFNAGSAQFIYKRLCQPPGHLGIAAAVGCH